MDPGRARESRHDRRRRIVDFIRSRVEARTHLGIVRPGSRLASARELAQELGVTPRLVMAAYAELEREGLVQRRERQGVYLADKAHEDVDAPEWAVDLLAGGLARGVTAHELPRRLHQLTRTVRLHVTCIECNEDHLHALCTELAHDYGFATSPLLLDEPFAPAFARRDELSSADLLVTTSFHAAALERAARALGRPWCAVSLNPELTSELVRRLRRGAVYVVAVDPRFVAKLRESLLWTHCASNLYACVLGHDDPSAIPPGASIYVSARARQEFTPAPGTEVLLEERAFAPESTRDLLRHLVSVNARAARPHA